MAKLPDNTSITINNVNFGANSGYYISNTNVNAPGSLQTEYDGTTTKLTTVTVPVERDQELQLVIVIAGGGWP